MGPIRCHFDPTGPPFCIMNSGSSHPDLRKEIMSNSKKKRAERGPFASFLDAIAAKIRAEREVGYHKNHGRADFA